jgi:cation:H+ antiporter
MQEFYGTLAILLLSLLVLYKSSEWVIKHAVVLARFFRISELAVGFLLISVATSLPELFVAVLAALTGQTGISVGNVLGANISDVSLVLGASAAVGVIRVKKKELVSLTGMLLAASLLPFIIFLHVIDSTVGVLLLAFFVAFAYFVLKKKVRLESTEEAVHPRQAVESAFFFCFAIAVVVASAKFVVDSAVDFALLAGVSKAFVAGTIVSMGTTIPELTVSLVAMKRGHSQLALGNVIGSCITNLTLVLGVASLLTPLSANPRAFAILLAFLVFINAVLWRAMVRKRLLARSEGILLLGIHALFLIIATLVELRW